MPVLVMVGYVLGTFGFLTANKGLFVVGAVLWVGAIGHMQFLSEESEDE